MLATLATSRTESLADGGDSTAAALTGGYQLAFGVGAGLLALALLLAAVVLEKPAAATQEAPASDEAERGLEPAWSEAA